MPFAKSFSVLTAMRNSTESTTSVFSDKRIAILIGLAAMLLGITGSRIAGEEMFSENSDNGAAAQLKYNNDGFSICYAVTCDVLAESANLPAAATPFFFKPIPINSADARLLETISGIGPRLASDIIRTRDMGVVFANRRDLLRIPGLGPKRALQLEGQISFSTNK